MPRLMNSIAVELGIESWKPVLTALLLPPLPLLLLVLIGARVMFVRRGFGWLLVLLGVAGIWASCSSGVATWVERTALAPPPALSRAQIAELRTRAAGRAPIAIVVLGSGREALAPEYGTSSLTRYSIERLRYALWLARETNVPVAFSGGVGWAQTDSGPPEAEIAARIAEREFGRPLRWREDGSRDTRGNARRTLALLERERIEEVVLVSHGWHLPRAIRAFDEAAPQSMRITAAPVGLAVAFDRPVLRWLPSAEGYVHMHVVLRELLARLAGA